MIGATQRHLYGTSAEIINTLDGSISSGATSVVLNYSLDGIGPRRTIAIDDELMYVLDSDAGTKTLTVLRGYRGTEAASHTDGVQVEVNPRFPKPYIRQALAEEIQSWPTSLYRVGTYDVSVGSVARGYDLPIGNYTGILGVYLSPSTPTTTEDWLPLGVGSYSVARSQVTDDFASGNSITFLSTFSPSRIARVIYTARFDTSSMDDAVNVCSTIGLACSMTDIPPLGAAWRLIQGKEVRRIDLNAQGQNRMAEQVQAGVASATTRAYKSLRDERIQQERARLMSRYPMRF